MSRKKPILFSRNEWLSLVLIFSVLSLAIFVNLRVSIRKSRDSQRKDDVRSIHDALKAYREDFGYYPLSRDGRILACSDGKVELDESGQPIFEACEWLYDSLSDRFDLNYPDYLEQIPTDPDHNEGARYYYLSDGENFQIYASLEGRREPEYDSKIKDLGLPCGTKVCNFGRSSDPGEAPLYSPLSSPSN